MDLPKAVFQNLWLADDDIDDQDIFRDAISQILPSSSLVLALNGDELMDLFANRVAPDILFLDLNMPGKDGLSCLREINTKYPIRQFPIVVFTSSIQPKHIEESYKYGANLYYSKPYSFGNLIAGLSNLFQMDWSDPGAIRDRHIVNEKFVAYNYKT
jgi:DNA-binding NarL/FixJ family response regulator